MRSDLLKTRNVEDQARKVLEGTEDSKLLDYLNALLAYRVESSLKRYQDWLEVLIDRMPLSISYSSCEAWHQAYLETHAQGEYFHSNPNQSLNAQ